MRAVVVFFSVSGHTKEVGNIIASECGFDVLPIKARANYPLDVLEVEKRVVYEQNTGQHPRIDLDIHTLDSYGHIFLGSPVWFGQVSAPIQTLINKLDFTGRTVHPFMTCGGMQALAPGKFVESLTKKGAVVTDPLVVKYSHKGRMDSDADICSWAKTHMTQFHIS